MEVHHHGTREGGWVIYAPDYRVDIWRQQKASAGVPQELVGWKLETYTLSSAVDAEEAIRWAQEKLEHAAADDSINAVRCTVYARVRRGEGDRGVVRIFGDDPTRATEAAGVPSSGR